MTASTFDKLTPAQRAFWGREARANSEWEHGLLIDLMSLLEVPRIADILPVVAMAKTIAESAAAAMSAVRFSQFDFGEALRLCKSGKGVSRAGWNGNGKGLWLEHAGACGEQLAHVCLHYPDGTNVPWAPSQTDMLAEDWFVV